MSNKNASIQLKIAKAKSLLAGVDVLMQHHFYITAINRLYYSCFHAIKALLLKEFFEPSKAYVTYIGQIIDNYLNQQL
jgi:uncharacterized protein (UPF0332 family)